MTITRVQAARGIDGQLVAVASGALQEAFEYGGKTYASEAAAKIAKEKDDALHAIDREIADLTSTLNNIPYGEVSDSVREFISDFVDQFAPQYAARDYRGEGLFNALWKANEAYARLLKARLAKDHPND